jgi:hypothetical protein
MFRPAWKRAIARVGSITALALTALAAGAAAEDSPLWPDADYDPAVPSLRDVLGHRPGERIVSPEEALRYLEALRTAAPDRIRIVEYGRTWEDRPLVYAVIGSPANVDRLDAIKAGMQRLADPRRTPAADAESLIRELPAVVWLGYGIHGDEISSTDAALYTAYHLLAARGDRLVDAVTASTVAILDPSQNPDGRARFVAYNRGATGRRPSSHPEAAERDQPWPGGRTNHYHFDLNRDLIALTQPESRARVRAALEWYPLVFVDAHEMGSESSYFFPPNAEPANPHITDAQQAALELFGRNNARWFDRFGFAYFTRETFDFFYPGYADTWATFQGGVGMTYEQASARGLVVRRDDGSLLTYGDGVRRHFVASLATLETAAQSRERLLRDFWAYRSSAIEEGRRGPVREHVLPARGDLSLQADLAAILVEQGVEVRRSTRTVKACGQELPAGSVFVSTAQPAGRFARTLLERGAEMQESFVREQERRRRKGLPHEMYDITAWSLPILYGVEQIACDDAVDDGVLEPIERAEGARRAVPPAPAPAQTEPAGSTVAWVVPWGTAAAGRFLVAALERGLDVLGADAGLTLGGRSYPRGTLIVEAGEDAGSRSVAVAELVAATGAEAVATSSSWVEKGIGFGSDRVVVLRRPEVALAWDEPTAPTAAGAVRWVLERRLGLAVTPVRTSTLAGADLAAFDVVILPDGGAYAGVLAEAGAANLERFVERGGVLIGVAGAVSYLADPSVALLSIRKEKRAVTTSAAAAAAGTPTPTPTATGGAATASTDAAGGDTADDAPDGDDDDDASTVGGTVLRSEADYLAAIAAEEPAPDVAPGALVRAVPDPDHWLTVGLAPAVHVMVQGSSIFSPIRLDDGVNALRFAAADELVASGHLWKENREQLAWKPFAVVEARGRGMVIGFTADLTFRGVLAGCDVLLLNAVVRAPAHRSGRG